MYMNRIPLNKRLELMVDDVLEKQDQRGPIDIENGVPGQGGMNFGHDSRGNRLGVAMVYYNGKFGEFVLEADIFPHEKGIMVHLYCPVCSTADKPHNLQITPERKKMEWSKDRGLSVEPFECTWEMPGTQAQQGEAGGAHSNIIVTPESRCRFRIAIDDNLARDV